MRWMVCAALLGLLLAGCVDTPVEDEGGGDGAPPPADPSPTSARSIDIELPGCRVIEAFMSVEAAAAQPHIPDGFTLQLQDARAVVVLGGLSCSGGGLSTDRAFLAILVEPTHEALRAEGDTNHFWEPEHLLVNGTGYAGLTSDLGARTTSLTAFTLETEATGGRLEATLSDGTAHTITTSGLAPPGPFSSSFGHFREYSAADGGYTYLEATFGERATTTAGAGIGEVTTAPGTPARDILGATVTTTVLYGTDLPYDDASLGFIPWPPE